MNVNDITAPLRLAVGSHKAGSGQGCAMNVISWENGDATITDLPSCADPMLSRVVQRVNDAHCTHRDGDLLCPPCSVEVLALAHRTAGTVLTGWDDLAVRRVWVRLALDEAESAARPDEDVRVARCREAVAAWLDDPSPAAYAAAYAAASGTTRMERAHRLIDRFEALTGTVSTTPDPAVTEAALDAMRRVTA